MKKYIVKVTYRGYDKELHTETLEFARKATAQKVYNEFSDFDEDSKNKNVVTMVSYQEVEY